MWEVAFLALFGAAAVGLSVLKSRTRLQAWQDAAASCGLEVVEASGWGGPRLHARAGPLEVDIETFGDKGKSTRIVVEVPGPPDFGSVRIRPDPWILPWMQEIEIGDEPFDSTFFIEGPTRLVLALLDAATRRLLLRVNDEDRCQLEVSQGALRAEMSGHDNVSNILPLLLDASQRLARPLDVPQRLAENANRDPEAGVRLQNLLLLVRELPDDPVTVEALRTACSDTSPEVRLHAAKELGAEGRGILLELAESRVDDAVSAQAVSFLDRELPFESARAILGDALRVRRLQTARACLEALGRSGAAVAVDTLAEVMAQEQGELAAAAALALGATGSPAAEPALILALQREQADLRIAAANALALVGSVEAVLPLKETAERSWLDLELRRATRQAIAEIQSRLHGASPGQLSLAEAGAGQLSLAGEPAGQLSFPTEEPGQLSLSGDGDQET